MKLILSLENLKLLAWIAEHGIVTPQLVAEHFYDIDFSELSPEERTKVIDRIGRRLKDLCGVKMSAKRGPKKRYLTRVKSSKSLDGSFSPIPYAYYLRKPNFSSIDRVMDHPNEEKESIWKSLLLPLSQADNIRDFSAVSIGHEILITKIHLALSRQCEISGEKLLFFYRMPLRHFLNDRIFQMEKYRSKLTNNLMDREEAYPVVFDAIACVESAKGNRVLVPIEADNDSERIEKITKKLKGIELYRKENRLHLKRPFRDSEGRETSLSHAEWLNAKFSITDPEYISRLQIRVFVITVNDKARNSFFFTTTDLPEDYFYYFASISDFERNPFDAIYLCKGNFTVSKSVKDDIKAAKGTTRYLKMKNAINPMKRQAFPFGRPRS